MPNIIRDWEFNFHIFTFILFKFNWKKKGKAILQPIVDFFEGRAFFFSLFI